MRIAGYSALLIIAVIVLSGSMVGMVLFKEGLLSDRLAHTKALKFSL